MADVLSQSEVESLLAALDTPEAGASTAVEEVSSNNTRQADDPSLQISVYDFKRPERVSKEQMRAFQALHDGFGREFGAALSGMLRTIIEVKLISVDQLTYSEFVYSLENPTCFNLLRADTLDGHLILDLSPTIIFPIIDRLLGGGKQSGQNLPKRPLTEIELRLVSRITNLAIVGLRKAWSNICDLQLHVSQVESNPQLVQIVPPNEVTVLISFEISMGEMRGIMNLCIPFNTIEPLASQLAANTWSNYTQKKPDPIQVLNLEANVGGAGVQMVVELAKTKLTMQELANLAVGDIIMTEQEPATGMRVLIEGAPKFLARAGIFKGHKAICIGDAIPRPSDLVQDKLARQS